MESRNSSKTRASAGDQAEISQGESKKPKLVDEATSVEKRHARFLKRHLFLNDHEDPFEVEHYSDPDLIHFHWERMLQIRDNMEKVSGFGERRKTTVFVGLSKDELIELMKEAAKFEEGLYLCRHPLRILELRKKVTADRSDEPNLPIGRIIQFGIPGNFKQPDCKPFTTPNPTDRSRSNMEDLVLKTGFKGLDDASLTSPATPPGIENLPSTPKSSPESEENWSKSQGSVKSLGKIGSKFMAGSTSSGSQQASPQKSSPSSSEIASQKSETSSEEEGERIRSVDDSLDPTQFRAIDDHRQEFTFDIVWGMGYPLIGLANKDGVMLPVHLDSIFWVKDDDIVNEDDTVDKQKKIEFVKSVRLKCGLVRGTSVTQVRKDLSHPSGCGALLKYSALKFKDLDLVEEGDTPEAQTNID